MSSRGESLRFGPASSSKKHGWTLTIFSRVGAGSFAMSPQFQSSGRKAVCGVCHRLLRWSTSTHALQSGPKIVLFIADGDIINCIPAAELGPLPITFAFPPYPPLPAVEALAGVWVVASAAGPVRTFHSLPLSLPASWLGITGKASAEESGVPGSVSVPAIIWSSPGVGCARCWLRHRNTNRTH